jgi:hypothetical protein
MQTHPLHVSDARERLDEARAELLAFTDVLDVFATGRGDVLMVVCAGRPRPGEWARALRAAGYQIPPRRHVSDAPGTPEARTAAHPGSACAHVRVSALTTPSTTDRGTIAA